MEKIYANVMIAKVYNTILGDIKKKLMKFNAKITYKVDGNHQPW